MVKEYRKLIIMIIIGGLSVMSILGCEKQEEKNNREWIEKRFDNIDKVYKTENLSDLFRKFPNGFIIRQNRLEKGLDSNSGYIYRLELVGDSRKEEITGTVKKVLTKGNPYRETTEKVSDVKYVNKELELVDSDMTAELLPKKYFLFQKIELNKNILKKMELEEKNYSSENGTYSIEYKMNNNEIVKYFNLSPGNSATLRLSGYEGIEKKGYIQGIIIREKHKGIDYSEEVLEVEGKGYGE
jgi:hypothetical protein